MTLSPKAKANIHHKAHTGLRIYHYHTDHLGTPQELTNDRGEVVWLNYQMAWGGSFSQLNHVYNLDGLDAVFVNIVVTQFNIKRLKPHWH